MACVLGRIFQKMKTYERYVPRWGWGIKEKKKERRKKGSKGKRKQEKRNEEEKLIQATDGP